ncbi:hypothetical protein [Neisseria montereyensis]|uniref:Uncharacterized protein n=1 Tax=Neisseria montereyensis TaxID=2973938 RepID=A0ABT2FDE1_9NEIS|nr:hypothetical protein [Neisseria montereyensis]MCS4533565.1 hypothetical protein [Neisseria montereyensis]
MELAKGFGLIKCRGGLHIRPFVWVRAFSILGLWLNRIGVVLIYVTIVLARADI